MVAECFESRSFEIEVLTPVFIGGQYNIQSFEFVKDGEYLYFLNFDKLLEENLFKESFIDEMIRALSGDLRDFNIRETLSKYNIDFKKAAKYRLKLEGVQRLSREVVSFVKSAGRFYIPGSSLKGAMRSFLTKALKKQFIKLYEDEIDKKYKEILNPSKDKKSKVDPQHLDSEAEEKIFLSPQESPFRYLEVSDTAFISEDGAAVFEIKVMNICNNYVKWFAGIKDGNARNVDDPQQSFSILAEGIKPGVKVCGTIKVKKDFVDGNQAVKGIKEKIDANILASSPVEFLCGVIKEAVKDYIQRERNFYNNYQEAKIISKEYGNLLNILNSLESNQFLLQIGFSTGYLSKTVGIHFSKPQFEKLKLIDKKSKIYPNLFPKSRRIVFKNGKIWTVPGWVKITIK